MLSVVFEPLPPLCESAVEGVVGVKIGEDMIRREREKGEQETRSTVRCETQSSWDHSSLEKALPTKRVISLRT